MELVQKSPKDLYIIDGTWENSYITSFYQQASSVLLEKLDVYFLNYYFLSKFFSFSGSANVFWKQKIWRLILK